MTSYETIYERFAQKVTDYDFQNIPEDDLKEMLHGWLMSSIVKCKRCKSDLSNRDDENECFNVDLEDEEIEILAMLMVVEWIDPQLNSVLFTNQFIGGKEEKFYAQSNHLSSLIALRDSNESRSKKLMRDYSYIDNSYFD